MTAMEKLLVVEFAEGVAGPCCGLQLADLGARVIKIERPDGDRAREWGPANADEGALFEHMNRGKESVVLDLARAEDRERLNALLAAADAVVAQNDPGEANEPDWVAIARANPKLVVCEIDDFGPRGAFAGKSGSELTIQAMSGFTRYVGEPGGDPCRVGFEIAWMATAMHAYQAVAAGIHHRSQSGQGQYVRVSGLNSLLSMKTILLAAQTGGMDAWAGFHLNGPHWPPDTGWHTKDGQVTFDFRPEQTDKWVELCRKIGLGHLVDDPDYKDWRSTIYIGDRRFVYGEPYRKVFAQMTCEEASTMINDLDGISVKFQDYGEMLAHPQVLTLEAVVDVPNSSEGARTQVGFPFRYGGEERRMSFERAPKLGEHTAAVLAEFSGASAQKRAAGGVR
jgi:crotonobetainyl-CoA:carnitine CoA-transferase CaiB-like acyl-CoA transferase